MKPLLITQVLGRPQTTARCFDFLTTHTDMSELEWVVVDQDSTEAVKDVIKYCGYEGPQSIIKRDFNSGIVFGINEAIAKYRKPGQSIIKLDDDVIIESPDWLNLFQIVLQDPKIGSCLGRRPTFFIDEPSRFEVYKSMPKMQINEVWVEVATVGVVGCWWMIKGEVIDKMGYLNEVTQNDDWDYWHRMKLAGWDSVYIPDAVCKQPFDEPVNHPTYGIMKKMIDQQKMVQNAYNALYDQRQLYLGTIFSPQDGDMVSYLNKSNANYEDFKKYSEEVK